MQLLSVTKPNYLISAFNAFAARVGKTSLIMSLVSEEFPEEVEHPLLFTKFYFYCVVVLFCSKSKFNGLCFKIIFSI